MSIIEILFEHEDFLVINKPINVGMHGPQLSICHIMQAQTGIPKLYLVHRLDTATSGCLLMAKNAASAAILSSLFAAREVQKYYLAISDKKPLKKQGKISGDMSKSRGGSYKLDKTLLNPSITFFISQTLYETPLHTLETRNTKQAALRLFYLKPITGKTHQLRVVLKSLGAPILGDNRYKGSKSDRMYLHAHVLLFTYQNIEFSIRCWPHEGHLFNQAFCAQVNNVNDLAWPKYKMPVFKNKQHNSQPKKQVASIKITP